MLRGRVRLLLVLTCVHFMVAMGSMMYAMAAGMARFDGPQSEPGVTEIAASLVGDVLLPPGLFIWSSWASQNLPNAFEWLLMVANSALWAAVSVAVIARAQVNPCANRKRSGFKLNHNPAKASRGDGHDDVTDSGAAAARGADLASRPSEDLTAVKFSS